MPACEVLACEMLAREIPVIFHTSHLRSIRVAESKIHAILICKSGCSIEIIIKISLFPSKSPNLRTASLNK